MKKMKAPEMEIIHLDPVDIITASGIYGLAGVPITLNQWYMTIGSELTDLGVTEYDNNKAIKGKEYYLFQVNESNGYTVTAKFGDKLDKDTTYAWYYDNQWLTGSMSAYNHNTDYSHPDLMSFTQYYTN